MNQSEISIVDELLASFDNLRTFQEVQNWDKRAAEFVKSLLQELEEISADLLVKNVDESE